MTAVVTNAQVVLTKKTVFKIMMVIKEKNVDKPEKIKIQIQQKHFRILLICFLKK